MGVGFEIAVYEAKDPEGFAIDQLRLHEMLGSFLAFVRSVSLRSASEVAVFADVVVWESLEAAKAAAEELQSRPDMAWFGEALGPIKCFDHFEADMDPVEQFERLESAPVLELVVIRPGDADAFQAAQAVLHDQRLEARDGVVGHVRLPVNANGLAGDFIGWRDHAAMEQTGAAMMDDPALAPVFSDTNEPVVFVTFERTVA